MGCACNKNRKKTQYLWYKDGARSVVYNSEIEAKAKILRKGGAYIPYITGVAIDTQIAAAEALARQSQE